MPVKGRVTIIALAGKVPNESDDLLHTIFDVLLPITVAPTDLDTAIKNTSLNLERTAFEVGNLLDLHNASLKGNSVLHSYSYWS